MNEEMILLQGFQMTLINIQSNVSMNSVYLPLMFLQTRCHGLQTYTVERITIVPKTEEEINMTQKDG